MPNSVTEYYQRQAHNHPDQMAFFYPAPDFHETLSWQNIWRQGQHLARHMQQAGIKPQDRIGILSPSCAQWEIIQLATFLAGGVIIGLDPHDSVASYEFIIEKCKIRYLFVKGTELFNKITPLTNTCNLNITRIELHPFHSTPITEEFPLPDPQSAATILFSSGTTFEPKGIEYTHDQIFLTVETILQAFPEIPQQCRTTCWLPLSNLFQRIINFSCVAGGGQIFFVDKPQDIMNHLKTTSPHAFIAVPRFYEKVYDGIHSKINRSKVAKTLFFLASIFGRRRAAAIHNGQKPGMVLNFFHSISDRILFRKIREIFGKNILFAISGSAPMRKPVLEFFHMIGIVVLEAYGTTENIVPISANRFHRFKFGSVGIPMLKDSVKISEDKEILVAGPGVFQGYLGTPSESSFENGYYKTGDLGYFDEDGFLYIEGRKSEVFKTTTGKKIPAPEIDNIFKTLPYVDVALTLGENRKAPIVLITLDFPKLAQTLHMPVDNLWDLEDGNFVTSILSRISQDLTTKNITVPEKTRPAGFLVLTRKFVFENKEVTANLKIRRRHIEKNLRPTMDKLYLEIDANSKTSFWFLNSQDLEVSGPPETKITSSTAARFLKLIGLLSEVITTIWSYRLLSHSQSNLNRKLGQIFRNHLGRLRGPLQKVGQMMSYMHEDLPEEFREEVRELLKNSAPVNSFLIRSIVETELKQPIPLLFSEWSDKPISTASIGQVHFARLPSGEAVAVKVLLPQMDKIVRNDLFLLRLCLPLIKGIWKNANIVAHYHELKNLVLKECDFKQEARYYETFRHLFKNNVNIIIPEVKKDLSTTKVLVTSFVDGLSFDQFLHQADEAQRSNVAKIIWEFHCEAINRYAIFNADPHPGNYIIVGDKVCVVDFGFCKSWDIHFIDLWKKQTLAGCNNDEQEFVRTSKALGFFKTGDPDFIKNLMPTYKEIFYRLWIEDRDFKITHHYLKQYLLAIFEKIITGGQVKTPVEFLAIMRLYFENFSLMAELDVNLNYYRSTIPYLEERTIGHNNPEIAANTDVASSKSSPTP